MVKTKADFEPDNSDSMIETLEQVKGVLRRHYEIKDWQGIDIILAVACAHYIPGEMLWVKVVGASRSGKTELLRAIADHPGDCTEMESLTPAALRGGFKGTPKVLKRIDGKLVITKDIASILTVRKDAKNEIFGLLRSIKDGKLTADFGSYEGHLSQTAKFDWLLAATQYIEQQRQLEGLLGERFIDLRWRPGNREEMAFRAATNNRYMESIRAELTVEVLSLMYRARELAEAEDYSLTENTIRSIAKIADSVAIARTPVQQDRYGNLIAIPEPEVGTDIAQGLSRITSGLFILGLSNYQPYLKRIAWDCIPSIRARILQSLKVGPKTVSELAKAVSLPNSTVEYHTTHLELLKAVVENNSKEKEIRIELP